MTTFSMLFDHARDHGVHTLDRPRLPYLAGRAAFSGSVVEEDRLMGGSDPLRTLFELERRQQLRPRQGSRTPID